MGQWLRIRIRTRIRKFERKWMNYYNHKIMIIINNLNHYQNFKES